MRESTLGVGTIGVSPVRGWAATAHIPALRPLPNYEIRALSAHSAESARAAGEVFGVSAVFSDHERLVADQTSTGSPLRSRSRSIASSAHGRPVAGRPGPGELPASLDAGTGSDSRGREVGDEPVRLDLEQRLGLGQPGQTIPTEIAEAQAGRQ